MKTLSLQSLFISIITVGTIGLSPAMSLAETVQIPVGQQGQDKQSIQRPRTGMDQNQVRAQYGNPLDWTNPVGEPPISKWTYADFIVYFEYDHVIHSVLVHTSQPSNDSDNQSQPSTTDNDALSVLSRSE
jgi:outer membrane protein assembly factor BamE (lipoprotein component of BamABCDE complex)